MPNDATRTGLQVKLAESAVFLQSPASSGSRDVPSSEPTVVRGLLQFDVGKPIKVKEIKVELQAKSVVSWVEGIGTHPTDNTESHRVFSATHTVFCAPGVTNSGRIAEEDDTDSIYPDSVFTGNGQGPSTARNSVYSVLSGTSDRERRTSRDWHRSSRQSTSSFNLPPTPSTSTSFSSIRTPSLTPSSYTTTSSLASSPTTPSDFTSLAAVRPLHLHGYEDSNSSRRVSFDEPQMPKSPSYNSGRRPHHRRSTSIPVSMDPDLEDVPEVMTTPHASPHSSPNPDATPSNAPEPPPYSYDLPNTRNEPGAQRETEPARVALTRPPSRDDIHSRHGGASVSAPPTADSEDNRGRERKKRRFSLSSVFHAILGKGRSKSKSRSRISLASQDGRNDGLNPTSHREEPSTGRRERIRDAGMSVKSGVSGDSGETVTANRTKRERSIVEVGSTTSSQTGRSRLSFGMISDMLPDAAKDKTKDVVEGVGWREFKRGTYTYPVSFLIPGHAPPTLDCPNGNVSWRIKGTVVKAGAFSSNITTTHPVLVVSSPSPSMSCPSADEDLIVVERSWEDQLQYMISISGRSFHVGGRIPISFSLVPLRGIKIHRVGVALEEKIEYCTNFKRVARSDPVVAHQLLQLRQTNQDTAGGDHILPLPEATLQALQDSPLITVLDKNIVDQEHVGIFAGAGPWSWDVEVDVPGTCRTLRASCKNRRSNMKVEHLLKCVLRVERCPDEESMPGREPEGGSNTKKKRKLFDIVVQTPVMILNCRCSPELLALPSYEANFPEPGLSLPCPCVERRLSEWGKRASASSRNRASIEHSKRSGMILGDRASEKRSSTLSSITSSSIDHVKRLSSTSNSSVEATKDAALQQTMAALLRNEGSSLVPDTIASRNSQFERLVSGVESADGERVPGYES